ncbi:MAG: AraC family transcriptional regulator [Clostridia bacterium]|nr:AraC family transcriptional regulator [Clostridia bacterium]
MNSITISPSFNPQPFYYVYRRYRNENWTIGDSIPYYSLFMLLEGTADITINGTSYHLEAGEGILTPPYSVRYATTKTGFKQNDIDFYAEKLPFLDSAVKISGEKFSIINKHIDKINYLRLSLPPLHETAIKGHMLIIISEILSCNKSKTDITAEKIRKYIIQNYAQSINMQQIAEFTGLSKAYCGTIFKRHTGYSISEYICKLRIDSAIEQFDEEPPSSIEEISYNLGFCDVYHFIKVFKKVTGITPGQYKKSLIKPDSIP